MVKNKNEIEKKSSVVSQRREVSLHFFVKLEKGPSISIKDREEETG